MKRLKPIVAVNVALLIIAASVILILALNRPPQQPSVSLGPLRFESEQAFVNSIKANKEAPDYKLSDIKHYYRLKNPPAGAAFKQITVRSVYVAWQFILPDAVKKQQNATASIEKTDAWEAEHYFTFVFEREKYQPDNLKAWQAVFPNLKPFTIEGFSGYYDEHPATDPKDANPIIARSVFWNVDEDWLRIEMPANIPLANLLEICQVEKVLIK